MAQPEKVVISDASARSVQAPQGGISKFAEAAETDIDCTPLLVGPAGMREGIMVTISVNGGAAWVAFREAAGQALSLADNAAYNDAVPRLIPNQLPLDVVLNPDRPFLRFAPISGATVDVTVVPS